jgi:hypothetical protein
VLELAVALGASNLTPAASAKSRCRGFGPSSERIDFITVKMRGLQGGAACRAGVDAGSPRRLF